MTIYIKGKRYLCMKHLIILLILVSIFTYETIYSYTIVESPFRVIFGPINNIQHADSDVYWINTDSIKALLPKYGVQVIYGDNLKGIYKVKSFDLTYAFKRQDLIVYRSNSDQFTNEMIQSFNKLQIGFTFYIDNAIFVKKNGDTIKYNGKPFTAACVVHAD